MCWRLEATAKTVLYPTDDPLYELLEVGLIVMLELWLGVIVACVPTLVPLLTRYVAPVIAKTLSSLSVRRSKGSKGSVQSQMPLETIGAKRSRKKYWELGASQDALTTTFNDAITAEVTSNTPPHDLEPGTVHVQKDFDLRTATRI